jgi:hypothetical protein
MDGWMDGWMDGITNIQVMFNSRLVRVGFVVGKEYFDSPLSVSSHQCFMLVLSSLTLYNLSN